MLMTIFGACQSVSADAIVSLGLFVRKEGTEDPINPLKVQVWYTRIDIPFPEEKEADYIPQIGAWFAYASVKDERERACFKIRVRFDNTEQIREVNNLSADGTPDYYREYFYFHCDTNSRDKNPLLVNFLVNFFEKLNWQFPILRILHSMIAN